MTVFTFHIDDDLANRISVLTKEERTAFDRAVAETMRLYVWRVRSSITQVSEITSGIPADMAPGTAFLGEPVSAPRHRTSPYHGTVLVDRYGARYIYDAARKGYFPEKEIPPRPIVSVSEFLAKHRAALPTEGPIKRDYPAKKKKRNSRLPRQTFEGPDDTPALDTSFHDHEMDV